mgnify:FL=1
MLLLVSNFNEWIDALQFNYSSGQPAPESITDKIYGNTLSVSESYYFSLVIYA